MKIPQAERSPSSLSHADNGNVIIMIIVIIVSYLLIGLFPITILPNLHNTLPY